MTRFPWLNQCVCNVYAFQSALYRFDLDPELLHFVNPSKCAHSLALALRLFTIYLEKVPQIRFNDMNMSRFSIS